MKDLGDSRNFVGDYARYCSEGSGRTPPQTDAPAIFHEFIARALIGAVLGRQAYLRYGSQHLFPNFYFLLLASSSTFRKSTALNIGRRFLKKMSTHIFPHEWSCEALYQAMSEEAQGVFVYSEFATLLKLLTRDYASGGIPFLTDLYDCPEEYSRRTKGDGLVTIRDACPSLWAASTVEWLVGRIRLEDVYGGFIPRFLIIPAYDKLSSIALPGEPDSTLEAQLCIQLKAIKDDVKGAFDLGQSAPVYEAWFSQMERQILELSGSLQRSAVRLQSYCLKLAMVEHAATNPERANMVISQSTMRTACHLSDWLLGELKRLDEEGSLDSSTEEDKERNRVARIIRERGPIARSRLLKLSHVDADRLNKHLRTLRQANQIEQRRECLSPDGGTKTSQVLRWVENPRQDEGPS